MELRRQYLIQQLHFMKVYVNREGKLLNGLTVQELELEYSRAKDNEDLNSEGSKLCY